MNEFIHGKIPIDEFLKHHTKNFIQYCEIVIHPDGDIEYCIPSHQQKLIELTGLTADTLWNKIDMMSDVMIELCNMTNCVSVWFDLYINPKNVTKKQLSTLKSLKNSNCINSKLSINSEPGYHLLLNNK